MIGAGYTQIAIYHITSVIGKGHEPRNLLALVDFYLRFLYPTPPFEKNIQLFISGIGTFASSTELSISISSVGFRSSVKSC